MTSWLPVGVELPPASERGFFGGGVLNIMLDFE